MGALGGSAQIVFLNAIPWPLMLFLAAAAAAFLFFSYKQFSILTRTKLRILLAVMRSLLAALAFFFVLDPYWNRASDSDWIGVLADTSKSMNVQDAGAPGSRIEMLNNYFKSNVYWKGLQKTRLREYLSFDSQLRPFGGEEALEAGGDSSRLLSSMRQVDSRFRDDPNLMGWIVFTDGGATDYSPEQKKGVTESGFPWLVVGLGAEEGVANLHLEYPQIKEPLFAGDVLPLQLKWTSGLPAKAVSFLTVKLDGKPLVEKNVPLSEGHYNLELTTQDAGNHFLDISIAPLAGEGSDADNQLRVAFKTFTRQTRVFYGESYYKEHNFFKEALEEDPAFKVTFATSVIGFARKNRISFIQDPIYGFPRTRRDLLQYDAIVLSDVKRKLLSNEQIDWIRELVEKEGGALIMVGGMDSFGDGGYAGTPVEKMLPVEIGEDYKQKNFLKTRGVNENPFRAILPDPELGHPLLQLVPEAAQNKKLWEAMPLLGGYNNTGRVKPAATVLLQHPSDTSTFGPRVIMAVQSFGRGKVLAFTSDITPNWGEWFQAWKEEKEGWLYARFWRNTLKWLTENRLRGRVSLLELTREPLLADSEKPLRFIARLPALEKDAPGGELKFQILKDRDLVLSEIFTDPENAQAVWKIPHLEPGDYTVKALYEVRGELPLIADMPFSVHTPRDEAEHLKMNPELLKKLAQETQGVYLPFNKIGDLDRAIAALRKANLRKRSKPFWNHPLFYAFFLGILFTDWVIRKKKGLE